MPCAALMPRDERRNGDFLMPALEPLRTSAPPFLWRATGRTPVGACSHDVHRASVTLRFCATNLLRSVPPACGMDSLMAICDGSWRREHDCIRHTPPTCPWQHRHVSARHSKPPAFCTMLAGWGTSLGNGSTLLPCLSVSLRYVLACFFLYLIRIKVLKYLHNTNKSITFVLFNKTYVIWKEY